MLKFGTSNVGKVFAGTSAVAGVYSGNNLIWSSAVPDTIFNVSKITSNVYANSTTYNDCKFLGFSVLAKAGQTAEVTYGGITKTVTRPTGIGADQYVKVTFGQYGADADDGTPDTGNITFKNVDGIGGFSFNTAKNTSAYAGGCFNSVVDWGGLKYIGPDFLRGSSITSFTVGGRVTDLDIAAFRQTQQLTSLTLGASVQSVITNTTGAILSAVAPFIDCSNLNIYVDTNSQYFSAQNGALYNKNKTELCFVPYASASSSYSVPSSVTTIRRGAFYGRTLTSITLNNVTKLEGAAFSSCSNLATVTGFSNITYIETQAFSNCSLTTINLSQNLSYLGSSAFTSCPITSITFNGYVGTQASLAGAFSGLGSAAATGRTIICNANIPDHLFDAGSLASFSTKNLTLNGVTTIGNYAFNKVNFIEDGTINLGNSLTTIGSYAFANGSVTDTSRTASSSLTVEIPASVTSMGDFSVNTFKNINDFGVRAAYPPSVSDSGIEIFATDYAGLGENLKIYVPDDSLADYQSEWYGLVDFMEGVIGW